MAQSSPSWAIGIAADEYLTNWEFYTLFALVTFLPIPLISIWIRIRKPNFNGEWFLTAGRNLQTGLTAASLVVIWTGIIATLIVPRLGYQYGLSGIYSYAVGMALPLLVIIPFSLRLKKDTPLAHTFPEWTFWRFGAQTHKLVTFLSLLLILLFLLFALLLVTGLLQEFTGIDPYLILFLLSAGFTIYALIGGLRGTILAGYVQCSVIVVVAIALAVFFCNRYGDIGIYEKLQMHQEPQGTALSISSSTAILIGSFSLLLHFGLVFGNQAVWQRCIATSPRSNVQMLLVAGLSSFAICIALGTVFGLGGQGLGISVQDSRWIMTHVVYESLGHRAMLLFFLIVLLSLSGIGASHLLAGASVLATDMYRRYWVRNATDEQLLLYTRVWTGLLGAGTVLLASYLWSKGVAAEQLYYVAGFPMIGCLPPIMLGMFWRRVHGPAAFWAGLLSLFTGIAVWVLLSTWRHGTMVSQALEDMQLLVIANASALGVSLVTTILLSLVTDPKGKRQHNITSFLSRKDIREQSIVVRFSRRAYAHYIHRTTSPIQPLISYIVLGLTVLWIFLLPALALTSHEAIGHGVFVMWLIGALVAFMLSGGYLLLTPIIDVFQEEEPVVLALSGDEEEDHVSESQN